jgi:adenylate kinase
MDPVRSHSVMKNKSAAIYSRPPKARPTSNGMDQSSFIFSGRSGSGKSTQVKLFAEYLGEKGNQKILQIETGNLFREFVKGNGYTHQLSRDLIERGDLQPMFLTTHLWSNDMVKKFTGTEQLIFDGMPRKLHQAEFLDEALTFYKQKKRYVILINVSREWSEERLNDRGRSDDQEEYIKTRMDWHESDVVPALDYLRANTSFTFLDINGEQPIEDVHKEIVDKIGL